MKIEKYLITVLTVLAFLFACDRTDRDDMIPENDISESAVISILTNYFQKQSFESNQLMILNYDWENYFFRAYTNLNGNLIIRDSHNYDYTYFEIKINETGNDIYIEMRKSDEKHPDNYYQITIPTYDYRMFWDDKFDVIPSKYDSISYYQTDSNQYLLLLEEFADPGDTNCIFGMIDNNTFNYLELYYENHYVTPDEGYDIMLFNYDFSTHTILFSGQTNAGLNHGIFHYNIDTKEINLIFYTNDNFGCLYKTPGYPFIIFSTYDTNRHKFDIHIYKYE